MICAAGIFIAGRARYERGRFARLCHLIVLWGKLGHQNTKHDVLAEPRLTFISAGLVPTA